MNGNGRQKILHDAYFNKAPGLIPIMAVRLALLCIMNVSAVLFLVDLYDLPCGYIIPAAAAAGSSILIYLLTSLFPSVFVYGAAVIAGGALGYFFRKSIMSTLLYFWDYMMLHLDSRLLHTGGLFYNESYKVLNGYLDKELEMSCTYMIIAVSVLLAFVFNASCRTRCRIFAPIFILSLLSAAAFAAEKAGFSLFVFVFVSVLLALRSVAVSYELDSSFVYGGIGSVRRAEKRSERSYRRKTRLNMLLRKIRNDIPRYGKYTSNAVTMFIVSAAVFAAAVFVMPIEHGLNYKEVISAVAEFGNKASDKVSDFFNNVFGRADEKRYFTYSGYSDISGEISLEPPSDSNKEVLSVTLGRSDIPVYLRGDIGVDFSGKGWNSISSVYDSFVNSEGVKYSDIFADFYPEEEYQVFRLSFGSSGLSPDLVMPLQKVSVEYKHNTRVVFQPLAPYELNYKQHRYFDSFGDFILRTKTFSGYVTTFESLSLTPRLTIPGFSAGSMKAQQIVESAKNGSSAGTFSGYDEKITQYRNYVRLAYSGTDAVTDDFMRMLYNNGVIYRGMSDFAAATAIGDYFRNNFTYSVDAENGEDAVFSFLYDTQEGHCALFATAMTLCLRDMGIPARYVTGYVVSGSGKETDDGYVYTLAERDLHAWVEAYFEGVGWLPFDPTAASAEENAASPSAPVTTTTSMTTPVPPETTHFTEPAPEFTTTTTAASVTYASSSGYERPHDDEKHENPIDEYLPYIIIAAAVILLAAALALFIRAVSAAEKRTFDGFLSRSPNEATGEMYRLSLVLLASEGIVPQKELIYDFARRVDSDILMKGTNIFMCDIVDIIEKCEFGNAEVAPVAEDERMAVYKFTAAVYLRVMDNLNPIKRFFVKISLFM